jgi:hypothetical protein
MLWLIGLRGRIVTGLWARRRRSSGETALDARLISRGPGQGHERWLAAPRQDRGATTLMRSRGMSQERY